MTRGNAVLACRDCNELKGNLSEKEFELIVTWADTSGVKLERTSTGHLKPFMNMRVVREHIAGILTTALAA